MARCSSRPLLSNGFSSLSRVPTASASPPTTSGSQWFKSDSTCVFSLLGWLFFTPTHAITLLAIFFVSGRPQEDALLSRADHSQTQSAPIDHKYQATRRYNICLFSQAKAQRIGLNTRRSNRTSQIGPSHSSRRWNRLLFLSAAGRAEVRGLR